MNKLIQQYDGEWFQPIKKGWVMGCCDCGLVHKVNFRIKNGAIQMQVFRDSKATSFNRKKTDFSAVEKRVKKLIKSGLSYRKVMKLMGWKSPHTVQHFFNK